MLTGMNLFASPVEVNTTDGNTEQFDSVERAYAVRCARHHKNAKAEKKIRDARDAYEVKHECDEIRKDTRWEANKVEYLEEIVLAKFQQNHELQDKLLNLQGHIYESTTHPVFGCGFTLRDFRKISQGAVQGNRNQMGKILSGCACFCPRKPKGIQRMHGVDYVTVKT